MERIKFNPNALCIVSKRNYSFLSVIHYVKGKIQIEYGTKNQSHQFKNISEAVAFCSANNIKGYSVENL